MATRLNIDFVMIRFDFNNRNRPEIKEIPKLRASQISFTLSLGLKRKFDGI